MSYEDALHAARSATVEVPAFAGLDATLSSRREARIGNDARVRRNARRWLWLAAAAFIFIPADALLHGWLTGAEAQVRGIAVAVALPIAMLLWAGQLVARPSFRAQVLVRSIAVSNLIVALLLALVVGGMLGGVGEILIALGCARSLRLLDDRGLDGREPDPNFAPVAFRGFLILALVMAFADAQTLAFSALTQASYLLDGVSTEVLAAMVPTTLAAMVMALGVWGLLHLRTWAMLLNIVANLVIARLALTGALNVNDGVAVALATTAAIQLMLPVPILATWIGDRNAGGGGWRRGAALLRVCVPLAVLLTALSAAGNFGFARMWGWLDGTAGTRALVRGVGALEGGAFTVQLPGGKVVGSDCGPWEVDGSGEHPQLRRSPNNLSGCDFSNTDLHGLYARGGTFFGARFLGAELSDAVFVSSNLNGADFSGAELRGVMFVGTQSMIDVRWVGATCPDGFVATADEGCEAHLDSGRRIEADALAGRFHSQGVGCTLRKAVHESCSGLLTLDIDRPYVVEGRGEQLVISWGVLGTPGELVFEREGSASWTAGSGANALHLTAFPKPPELGGGFGLYFESVFGTVVALEQP
ncbi:MAG: pentapeptide repeat-containing protein [Myxococcales bacterium]|nr:pentapeptide repeat-containing protein [Myxococcales bacterium]